jgi:hypothetical protein
MWDLFDQWIVLMALGWALWIIYRNLSKKSFQSCSSPCEKKIFSPKTPLVSLKRKLR